MFSSARQHNSAKLKHSQENFKQVANKYNRARFNNSFKTHTSCKTYISANSQKHVRQVFAWIRASPESGLS